MIVSRKDLLRHLRACKALALEMVRIDADANEIVFACTEPMLRSSLAATGSDGGSAYCDAAGLRALIGSVASLDCDEIELGIDARTIEITGDRRHILVDVYPEAEEEGQVALFPRPANAP